ncbi:MULTISPECIES: cell envelope integrity protein TolA [Rhizobium]|uniref:cell envelope integrity protein TolA n=1 Tax=Rhizobium TaxID=379 RepID=UPI00235F2967|nr:MULTISPECIES: cell envelope integrity protein TolA [unclassified Rhizobium]MDC9811776.1 cell envelope integrity protein TolA [Rhizobium sp. MC62]WEA24753.1 cell envelope integrity protein TolA [Rhizobium sp. MJ22]WEA59268.1 cell envelope integrity protein TolA [Rhizobium sp. BJ04]
MPRNSIHFAKSFGVYAVLTGAILGLAFPFDANAETADRRNGASAPILNQAEITAVVHSIERQLFIHGRLKDIGSARLTIHIKLTRDGQIVGNPDVQVTGGSERAQKSLADDGLRAVRRAAPFTMLPKDKYDVWKEIVFNFDTSALTQ